MLIVADVKSLEVVTCAFLSQDNTLANEVREGVDFHEQNRVKFGLPNRTIAKIFMFKLIYGATAWGYANDGDFIGVSNKESFWQEVIDEFYAKYTGIRKWHTRIVQEAISTGTFQSPTARVYRYNASDIPTRLWFWRPKILNYPVQGLGADLVMLARISFWNRFKARGMIGLPISSVHDSIVVDSPKEECYTIGKMLKSCVRDVPMNFKKVFGKEFNVPLNAEIKVGNDLKNMEILEC